MRELKTISKENFKTFLKAIGEPRPKCSCCYTDIKYKNMGIFAKGFYSCSNRDCMKVVIAEMMMYDDNKDSQFTGSGKQ